MFHVKHSSSGKNCVVLRHFSIKKAKNNQKKDNSHAQQLILLLLDNNGRDEAAFEYFMVQPHTFLYFLMLSYTLAYILPYVCFICFLA